MAFSTALSGLTAASSDLDVTANNIANADTIGFKDARAQFADVYAAGAVNLNNSVIGQGVRSRAPSSNSPRATSPRRPRTWILRSAATGSTPSSANGYAYSRNGQFGEDKSGNVISSTGQALQVYPPLINGGFNTGTLTISICRPRRARRWRPQRQCHPEFAGEFPASDRGGLRPDELAVLQPVHIDDGVRLPRQRVPGDHVLPQTAVPNLGGQHDVNGTRSAPRRL